MWLTRSFGLPWAITLVNLIPGVAATVAIRFAVPSIEFSVFVLAAFALADWRLTGAAASCRRTAA